MSGFDPDELVTARVIAQRKGCDINTIYVRRHRGQLPGEQVVHGRLVWRWGDVEGLDIAPRETRAIGRPQAADGDR